MSRVSPRLRLLFTISVLVFASSSVSASESPSEGRAKPVPHHLLAGVDLNFHNPILRLGYGYALTDQTAVFVEPQMNAHALASGSYSRVDLDVDEVPSVWGAVRSGATSGGMSLGVRTSLVHHFAPAGALPFAPFVRAGLYAGSATSGDAAQETAIGRFPAPPPQSRKASGLLDGLLSLDAGGGVDFPIADVFLVRAAVDMAEVGVSTSIARRLEWGSLISTDPPGRQSAVSALSGRGFAHLFIRPSLAFAVRF